VSDDDLTRVASASAAAPELAPELADQPDLESLLIAEDAESIELLAAWLKSNAKTFAPVVLQAIDEQPELSPEAASAVLDALSWHSQTEEDTTLKLMESCLDAITRHITRSLDENAPGPLNDRDDRLMSSAVAALTADRRSRHSETAVRCLADTGPGGALVLARAFDAVRGGLKLYIVRHLDPADVLELEDNVVVSLSHSLKKFAEELEDPKKRVVTKFLTELGPIERMERSEIGSHELLRVGDSVFHARWGTGTVTAANEESATIDFGSAGTRTLLRAFTTLRHAV